MKRHESLAPLSREHHSALILAQLLKKDAPAYKGLPTGTSEKMAYASKQFHDSLKQHFIKEEILINKLSGNHPGIHKLGREIIAEHLQLTGMFFELETSVNPVESMNSLGHALEIHIRKEERELFPLIQQQCSEEELEKVEILLR